MIKAIIFDFGSVIYKTDWEKLDAYFKKLNGFSIRIAESKDEELIKIYRDSDIGKQEYVKFFYHLEPNIKDIDKIIKDYKKAYGKFKKINRELLKIISFLKKKYLIFGFSDIKKEHYEANKECGIYDCFEEVFASFKFGVLKCDAGAFQRLEKELKKFNLPLSQFPSDKEPVFMRYPVLIERKTDEILKEARQKGFFLDDGWRKSVVVPPDTSIKKMNYLPGTCPRAEKVAETILNLPTHINISQLEARKIVEFLRKFNNLS